MAKPTPRRIHSCLRPASRAKGSTMKRAYARATRRKLSKRCDVSELKAHSSVLRSTVTPAARLQEALQHRSIGQPILEVRAPLAEPLRAHVLRILAALEADAGELRLRLARHRHRDHDARPHHLLEARLQLQLLLRERGHR